MTTLYNGLHYSITKTKEHKMRLDHFVLHNNHLTTTNGDNNMSKLETPSVTSSRGFQSSHNTWVNTMRFNGSSNHTRVWGRIQDNGVNFIVEGWKITSGSNRTEWVQIPCANLATAQMHLVSIMDKKSFNAEQLRQRLDRAQEKVNGDKLIQEILADIF